MVKTALKTISAAALLMLAACSGDKKDAQELYTLSEEAITAGHYQQALTLLDTLNARYPAQVEVRRNALGLRARAMEGLAMDSISEAEARLAAATLTADSLAQQFRHIEAPAPGMDGFWLPKGVNENAMASTGIQGRVSDDGYLYLVASLNGNRIGLKAIELRDGDAAYTTEAISAARLVTVGNSESAHFNQEELEGLGSWVKDHPGANRIVFVGSRRKQQAPLGAATRRELVLCAEYAQALQAKRLATILREKYERRLRTARDQIANTQTENQQ